MSGIAVFIALCIILALPWLWAAWQWCRPTSPKERADA